MARPIQRRAAEQHHPRRTAGEQSDDFIFLQEQHGAGAMRLDAVIAAADLDFAFDDEEGALFMIGRDGEAAAGLERALRRRRSARMS